MRLYGYNSIPGAPGNNLASTSFVIPGAMLPGAGIMTTIGNVGGMAQLPGSMPGAVGNMGGIQAFEDALNELPLPQNIRGSKYRYEQETPPSFFHNKRVY